MSIPLPMKIQINKYNETTFEFAKAYLKYWASEWLPVPPHRLVSPEFWKTLNDGQLDSNEYNIAFNPVRFDAEECMIVQRYYFRHVDKNTHDKQNIIDNTNMGRIFMELGPNGSVFKNRRSRKNSGGKRRRVRAHRTHRPSCVGIKNWKIYKKI